MLREAIKLQGQHPVSLPVSVLAQESKGSSHSGVVDGPNGGQYRRCYVICLEASERGLVDIAMSAEKKNVAKRTEDSLAKMVKDLRTKLGLTQEQFAAKVGVTFSTVNRWENGRGKPSPLAMRQIEELCERLG